MDFLKYKFVVSSGCSYGKLADHAFGIHRYLVDDKLKKEFGQSDWLDTNGQDVISINVSLGSQGSDWQSDSLIHVVSELLKLGVDAKNIYCLVEWSQWHRFTVHPPHHYGLDFNKYDFRDYDFGPAPGFEFALAVKTQENFQDYDAVPILSFLNQHFKMYRSTKCENWGKIDERIYMTPRHTFGNVYSNLGIDNELFYKDIIEIENRIPLENKIKVYFDNILRTQFFLEKNNLNYNFVFMQSTLSDWKFNDSGTLQHPLFNGGLQQYEIFNNEVRKCEKFNPINNPQSDIENIMLELKTKINQLNLDNFWFYENERFRRGGIDEWAIDNLMETGYVEFNSGNLNYNFGPHEVLPNYGHHPNMVAYFLLWNKVAFNCNFVKIKPHFENFIWEKYLEDYNYDGISKNYITLSKKEWDRIVNNTKLF